MSSPPPPLWTYRQAAQPINVPERTLRTEAKRGRLKITKLANRHYMTDAALSDMIEAATMPASSPPCPDAAFQPDSTSVEPEATAAQPGAFSTERKRLAQAAALMTVEA